MLCSVKEIIPLVDTVQVFRRVLKSCPDRKVTISVDYWVLIYRGDGFS